MKKTDKIALRQKSPLELKKILTEKNKELVELKSKQFLGNQKDTSVFSKIRYEISFVSSLLNQPQDGPKN
jgi:ribosomal protein L29